MSLRAQYPLDLKLFLYAIDNSPIFFESKDSKVMGSSDWEGSLDSLFLLAFAKSFREVRSFVIDGFLDNTAPLCMSNIISTRLEKRLLPYYVKPHKVLFQYISAFF